MFLLLHQFFLIFVQNCKQNHQPFSDNQPIVDFQRHKRLTQHHHSGSGNHQTGRTVFVPPVHTPGKSGSSYALIKIFRIAAAVSGVEEKHIGTHNKKHCRQPVGDSRHKHYVDAGLFYIITVVPAILPYGKAVFAPVGAFPKALQPDGTQQKHAHHAGDCPRHPQESRHLPGTDWTGSLPK